MTRGIVAASAFAAVLAIAAIGPAAGQERTPAGRQTLVDLAYLLGESHALRQLCEGEADQYWRSRMLRLLDLEAPDEGFRTRLIDSFSTGYRSAQASYPACGPAARARAARTALRGRGLADSLGSP